MDLTRSAAVLCLLAVAPTGAVGQAPDPAVERARLGSQRIQAEVERRAREESADADPVAGPASGAAGQPSPAPPATTSASGSPSPSPPTAPSPSPSRAPSIAPAPAGTTAPSAPGESTRPAPAVSQSATGPDHTTRVLEQLRQLGQLKDAGYLTDEEFQRIKSRIIQGEF